MDDEDPRRFPRIGFDTQGRLLELVALVRDDGSEELIHAMKCRPQYFGMLG
ncbi:toxin-antitoxin system toxin subunit [Arthrobacter sp. JSM 101049]|uniref:toxin-antitoxin system toxin subunit n=1 Tax=Arthrobacter sp. JSM 101049 TaxID=929097 RepID=UPI003562A6B9